MATNIERADADFNLQLKNFANKLPTYSAALNVSAAQVASIKADSLAFDYVLNSMITMQTFAHNYSVYKKQLRHGHVQALGALPVMPVLGTAPALVAADVEARFRALIQSFIHNANYTTAIGQDLGIEGPASTFNPTSGKPVFTIELTAGGHPDLHWFKGKFDGVEIWKDTGSGFLKLERVTLTHFTDITTLPAPGVAAVWRYKMIYLYNDDVVGAYSDVVSVTVSGQTGTNPPLSTGTPVVSQ